MKVIAFVGPTLPGITLRGVDVRLPARQGDVWRAVHAGEVFDIVISNPPYIAPGERDTLQPEVRDWVWPANR